MWFLEDYPEQPCTIQLSLSGVTVAISLTHVSLFKLVFSFVRRFHVLSSEELFLHAVAARCPVLTASRCVVLFTDNLTYFSFFISSYCIDVNSRCFFCREAVCCNWCCVNCVHDWLTEHSWCARVFPSILRFARSMCPCLPATTLQLFHSTCAEWRSRSLRKQVCS